MKHPILFNNAEDMDIRNHGTLLIVESMKNTGGHVSGLICAVRV